MITLLPHELDVLARWLPGLLDQHMTDLDRAAIVALVNAVNINRSDDVYVQVNAPRERTGETK